MEDLDDCVCVIIGRESVCAEGGLADGEECISFSPGAEAGRSVVMVGALEGKTLFTFSTPVARFLR